MRSTLWASMVLALGMSGCMAGGEFVRGFSDEGRKQFVEVTGEALDAKYGKKFEEYGIDLKDIEGKLDTLPKPKEQDPKDGTIWYGLGGLIAYILGSVGKAYVRKKWGDKTPSA